MIHQEKLKINVSPNMPKPNLYTAAQLSIIWGMNVTVDMYAVGLTTPWAWRNIWIGQLRAQVYICQIYRTHIMIWFLLDQTVLLAWLRFASRRGLTWLEELQLMVEQSSPVGGSFLTSHIFVHCSLGIIMPPLHSPYPCAKFLILFFLISKIARC